MSCIHGMDKTYCSYCNVERRVQEDLRRKDAGLLRRVNARLDSVGHVPDDVLGILLAGELSLVASPQHESTLKEQWRAATGRGLSDEQVTIDDAQRERFGTGCWYWYSRVTFSATDDEADRIELALGIEVKPTGKNRWAASSNALALFLGNNGMEPSKRND